MPISRLLERFLVLVDIPNDRLHGHNPKMGSMSGSATTHSAAKSALGYPKLQNEDVAGTCSRAEGIKEMLVKLKELRD